MLRGVATKGTIPKRLSNYDFKGVSYQWSGCGDLSVHTDRHLDILLLLDNIIKHVINVHSYLKFNF